MKAQISDTRKNFRLQRLQDETTRTVIGFINKWNLERKEAAEVFRVDYVTVRRWFNGDRIPDKAYGLIVELLDQLWEREGKPRIVC